MSDTTARLEAIERQFQITTCRDSDDSLDLRVGVWSPKGVTPDRWVIFLNGRTEWIEKYAYLPEDLRLPAKTGFLTWDHRGQGASGGTRAYVASYDAFARDAQTVVERFIGEKPYVALAHSMGGLICLYSVLSGRLAPKAQVLSSPLLGMPERPVPKVLAWPLAHMLSSAGLGRVSSGAGAFTNTPFENNRLTHDAARYRRMQAADFKIPGATFGWAAATYAAIDICFAERRLASLKTPTLVMGGSDERVVDPSAFGAWVQRAASATKAAVQLRMIAEARHELFSEVDQYYQPALQATREWLFGHLT